MTLLTLPSIPKPPSWIPLTRNQGSPVRGGAKYADSAHLKPCSPPPPLSAVSDRAVGSATDGKHRHWLRLG